MNRSVNSYMLGITFISIGLAIVFILQIIYSPCWIARDKTLFGFIGILILLITLINFPVGYFFKEKITFTDYDINIIFYSLIITGIIIGFGIVRIIITNTVCG